ncbi:MAG TPA: alpha/beta hydrolase-fold protein [Candidatus Saccharimonadales bacterium]|nr:alpha/beta hydrolase-fold protein [Candidatus Saccharimonadales bacterium]
MRTASGCAFVVALIFSLVLVNDYYHYFETIGQVLGISNARLYQAGTDDVTINYNEPNNQTVLNKASIQNAIYNLSHKNEKGNLYKLNIPGTISHFHPRNAYVYVPPAYSTPARINLPVIVLTAGTPGTPDNWPGAGLEGIMDQFAQSHDGITPLVFVVDNTGSVTNDTECVNSPRGNVETYLSVDVPSYIKNHFRVIDSPQHWAIGGLSMGGMCSLMLTLRHTDVYHYFIDLGGEIGPEVGSRETTINTLFNGSSQKWASHQPALLLKTRRYKGIGGFFGGGNQDAVNVTQAQSQLYQESKAAGIDAVSEVVNGAHTFNVWAQTYKDSLPWISDRIGATQCGPSCL